MGTNHDQPTVPEVGNVPTVSSSSERRPPDRPVPSLTLEANQPLTSDLVPPPVPVTAIPMARPCDGQVIAAAPGQERDLSTAPSGPTDTYAIASAICGLTAIVPVISQVAGLALGVVGMVRLRRARRAGRPLRGLGWAITGLVSSGVSLVGWVAIFVAFGILGASLAKTTSSLDSLSKPGLLRVESSVR